MRFCFPEYREGESVLPIVLSAYPAPVVLLVLLEETPLECFNNSNFITDLQIYMYKIPQTSQIILGKSLNFSFGSHP